MFKALAYHCLPSRAVGYHFLRSASGCLPGGATCENVLAIGVPKQLQALPKLIEDPMEVETCLMILAQISSSQYLVCPGSCKSSTERPPEKSSIFYKEGIRLITLNRKQLRPLKDVPCAPASLQEANALHPALKLMTALANCMTEIHAAEKQRRQPKFDAFIDTDVTNWPYEFVAPGKKLVIIWADAEKRLHAASTPYLSELIKLCSGATSERQ